MATTETWKEKIGQKLRDWKTSAEELNVQLHLGMTESKDEFQKQKKFLKEWSGRTVKQLDDKMEEWSEEGSERAKKLKTELEELRVQAALGRAESRDELYEQQKNINARLDKVRHAWDHFYDEAKEDTSEFMTEAEHRLEDMQVRFRLWKLKASHFMDESEDYVKESKEKFSSKLDSLKEKLKKGEERAEKEWDDYSKEVKDAWKDLKSSISG